MKPALRTHRLYVNSLASPDQIWSVDSGNTEDERHFKKVAFDSPGVSCFDLKANNVDQPRVWLEFSNSLLHIYGENAYIRRFIDLTY